MTIKEMRLSSGMTQAQCAATLSIPLRSYKRYEQNEENVNNIKYQYIIDKLHECGLIDETHGVLTLEQIQNYCKTIFPKYNVRFCYLFGSYARGNAKDKSDVDLLVDLPIDGLKFFELVEMLRETLKKKIDLLDFSQLDNNPDLAKEILKDGIKIYDSRERRPLLFTKNQRRFDVHNQSNKRKDSKAN